MSSPGQKVSDTLLGKGGGQSLTVPERMKRLGQGRNDAHLQMCMVVKVKSKEQYCIGTLHVRSMNQGKLDIVKQDMARLNINILQINKLKWIRMGHFNSDDHYICYCGQEATRRNGVALIVNKSQVQPYKCQNDHFQGTSLNSTVIQVYVPTTNAKQAKVDQFY